MLVIYKGEKSILDLEVLVVLDLEVLVVWDLEVLDSLLGLRLEIRLGTISLLGLRLGRDLILVVLLLDHLSLLLVMWV